jgi:hypothetical protein
MEDRPADSQSFASASLTATLVPFCLYFRINRRWLALSRRYGNADVGKRQALVFPPTASRAMDDDMEVQLQDLAADEIRELLIEAGADVSLEQVEQLARFVAAAGGLESALDVLGQLDQLRKAA